MKIYKISQDNNIFLVATHNVMGAHFVVFRIDKEYWAYRVRFPDHVEKIKSIARKSHGKALSKAKELKIEGYEVEESFPIPGSIIRQEGEPKKSQE